MSINRVALSGNLTREPELRATQGGMQILNFDMAFNDRRKNAQSGEWEDVPNFIKCVLFGKRAEALSRILTKGGKVSLEGKLRYSSWEKDGSKRSMIEVVVEEIELMSAPKGNRAQKPMQGANVPYSAPHGPTAASGEVYDEEIPF